MVYFFLLVIFRISGKRTPKLEQWLDGAPLVIIEDGTLHKDRMDKDRVDERDILASAHLLQGVERLDQIKYATIEESGEISIIPKPNSAG